MCDYIRMQICQPGTNLVIPHSVIFFLMIVQAFKLKIFHLNAMSLGQDYKKNYLSKFLTAHT